MGHLLVTNDFPPKVGGIQSYLWELWRRLPPEEVTVLALDHPGASTWDRTQAYRIERVEGGGLRPTPALRRRVEALADEVGAGLVLFDPAMPVGLLGPRIDLPFGVVLHGAEVTVPGRIPGLGSLLGSELRRASIVVAAGGYPAAEGMRAARRGLPVVLIPPGVDTERFRPLDPAEVGQARTRLGLPAGGRLVVSVSRLVPRKGMDVLIEAVVRLAATRPDLHLAIAGDGRDRPRLDRLVATHRAPVTFLGAVPDADLPGLYGAADVFAMLCRNRWAGLEQEGFGIVFLEAAASGVAQVAGSSGGSAEAVLDGESGYVVAHPRSVDDTAAALAWLLDDDDRRARFGAAARRRAELEFSYDGLAQRLADALRPWTDRRP